VRHHSHQPLVIDVGEVAADVSLVEMPHFLGDQRGPSASAARDAGCGAAEIHTSSPESPLRTLPRRCAQPHAEPIGLRPSGR
jgi:hypothetical protein